MKSLLIIVLQLASWGSDAYFTNRDLEHGMFKESDPLARPFVRSTRAIAISNGAGVMAELLAEHWLGKKHKRLEEAVRLTSIAGHTYGAATSAMREK